ncbi:PilZ domain-containing protein [Sporosarcina sp. FSL K6-3457]|uniref:PilZ domain-containing protein n=1 Tax=Sporosarcina sp. FSL K6-3457 TaxID=2978204 RepID=UPI0030F9C963
MLYKRNEYFRYTFGKPLEAEFRIVVDDGPGRESRPGDCQLIDISPGGAKLFTKFNISGEHGAVRLRIKFTLLEDPIEVSGVIVWRKPYSGGYMYGYDFDEDAMLEQVIVEELKLRRRSEINVEEVKLD